MASDEKWSWDPDTVRLAKLVGRHLPLFLGALPLLLFVLRVSLISRGDAAVLAALVKYTDLTTVVTSTMLVWLPTMFIGGCVLIISARGFRHLPTGVPELTRHGLLLTWFTFSMIYLLTRPWDVALSALAAIGAFAVFDWWTRRRRRKRGVKTGTWGVEPAAIMSVLAFGLYSTQASWLPLESVQTAAGQHRVGYVLHDGDPLVFLGRSGGLQYISSDDVKDRQPCQSASQARRPVLLLPADRVDATPSCPKQ